MQRRALDPRRIKTLRSYTVLEISELYGLHRHTVRRWLKTGLAPLEGRQRPSLVRGKELHRFISDMRAKRKRSCPAGTIFCVKCREPRAPGGNVAELVRLSETTGNLIGICPECDNMMYRRVSLRSLELILGRLDVSETDAEKRLRECP